MKFLTIFVALATAWPLQAQEVGNRRAADCPLRLVAVKEGKAPDQFWQFYLVNPSSESVWIGESKKREGAKAIPPRVVTKLKVDGHWQLGQSGILPGGEDLDWMEIPAGGKYTVFRSVRDFSWDAVAVTALVRCGGAEQVTSFNLSAPK